MLIINKYDAIDNLSIKWYNLLTLMKGDKYEKFKN